MSEISQSVPPSRRQAGSAESLSVSSKTAEGMLDYGKTKIAELVATGELESFVDGGARRIVTASIHRYVERKIQATKTPARRGPGRPRKADRS
jgi:hypothetical protein